MAQKPDKWGSVYAILSAMAIAIAPVATKQVLERVNIETFSFLWSLLAFAGALTYAASKGGLRAFRGVGQCWRFVMVMGLLTAVAVFAFSTAVRLSDPTLVSFFTRFETISTVLLGMLVFKERLNRLELLGAVITLLGALVMTYKAGEIVLFAFALGLLVALFTSISSLLAKVLVQYLEPVVIVASNRFLACLFTLLYAVAFGVLQLPSSIDFLVIMIGVFFGPFLGFLLFYKALSLSKVSRVSALRTSFPFFVALYSFFYLHTVPTHRQMLGGGIILAGLLLLISGRHSGWSRDKGSTVSI